MDEWTDGQTDGGRQTHTVRHFLIERIRHEDLKDPSFHVTQAEDICSLGGAEFWHYEGPLF